MRVVLWMALVAMAGLGAADPATALDPSGGSESTSSENFRVCAPPVTVGPVEECSIGVE